MSTCDDGALECGEHSRTPLLRILSRGMLHWCTRIISSCRNSHQRNKPEVTCRPHWRYACRVRLRPFSLVQHMENLLDPDGPGLSPNLFEPPLSCTPPRSPLVSQSLHLQISSLLHDAEPHTPESVPHSDDSLISPTDHLLEPISPSSSPEPALRDDLRLQPPPPMVFSARFLEPGRHAPSSHAVYSSALESESQPYYGPKGLRKKSSLKSVLTSPLSSPKSKKTPRRRSRASDAQSEKSHRSDVHLGGGYTLTPVTGKIFRNMLILEASLRQQVIQQRTMRRKYLTFLAALCSLIASISYHLYFDSDSGPMRVFLQLILLMLCVTLLLYHLSGEYQKTIVLPRKFLSSTNKGLRQLNVRLVKIKSSFADTTADLIREVGLFLCVMALKFFHTAFPSILQNSSSKIEVWLVSGQLRCQPRLGLNDVKLVLVPRSFNTDIREGWELYRNEFWTNEGIRRRNGLLDFMSDKSQKKDKKERRKRKPSTLPLSNLSEHNLEKLRTLSPESSNAL